MTVSELNNKLNELIKIGHGDTRVIANCNFTLNGVEYGDKPLLYLNDVYYQSGDIELNFNDREEV